MYDSGSRADRVLQNVTRRFCWASPDATPKPRGRNDEFRCVGHGLFSPLSSQSRENGCKKPFADERQLGHASLLQLRLIGDAIAQALSIDKYPKSVSTRLSRPARE
jgi:hypothetical protein